MGGAISVKEKGKSVKVAGGGNKSGPRIYNVKDGTTLRVENVKEGMLKDVLGDDA